MRDLIYEKVFAERMIIVTLSIVFIIIPVAMGFVLPVFYKNKLVGDYVVSLALLAVFIGIAFSRIYFELSGSAKAELEYRNKEEKVSGLES